MKVHGYTGGNSYSTLSNIHNEHANKVLGTTKHNIKNKINKLLFFIQLLPYFILRDIILFVGFTEFAFCVQADVEVGDLFGHAFYRLLIFDGL